MWQIRGTTWCVGTEKRGLHRKTQSHTGDVFRVDGNGHEKDQTDEDLIEGNAQWLRIVCQTRASYITLLFVCFHYFVHVLKSSYWLLTHDAHVSLLWCYIISSPTGDGASYDFPLSRYLFYYIRTRIDSFDNMLPSHQSQPIVETQNNAA